jgi:hypothetical protein
MKQRKYLAISASNILVQGIIALPIELETTAVLSKNTAMMANLIALLGYPCLMYSSNKRLKMFWPWWSALRWD